DWGHEGFDWLKTKNGLCVRLSVPVVQVEQVGSLPPRVASRADLTFTIDAFNSRGLDQEIPAVDRLVGIRLLYSPNSISRYGALVPRAEMDADWQELATKPHAAFKAGKSATLTPAEEMKLTTLDLRDWFDVSKAGFYRLQLVPAEKGSAGEEKF